MKRSYWIALLVAVSLLTLLMGMSTAALAAPLKGAIFTTTDNGSVVNENVHYEAKIDVYLDGGPPPNAPQTAAGLPDGDYVFQVTNPSGSVLLSKDASRWRVVRVQDGVIVALRDWVSGTTFVDHTADDAGHKEGKQFGMHDTNTDVDHGPPAIVVQLMPFLDTPNPGGVYKAWITPVSTYVAKGGNLALAPSKVVKYRGQVLGYQPDPGFGPPRDQVKTDNFKVKEFFPPEIRVRKFHDKNANGIWDVGEPEIGIDQFVDASGSIVSPSEGGGWPFSVLDPTGVTNYYYTPKTIVDDAGDYYITEGMFDHWKQTAAYLDGVAQPVNPTVKVSVAGSSGETHEVVFGNVHLGNIKARKFHDKNHDGYRDTDEGWLSGWEFTLYKADGTTKVTTDAYGNVITNPQTTDGNGWVIWSDLMPGNYVVKETPQDHWLNTTPLSQSVSLTACSTKTKYFGNVHLGNIKAHKFHDKDHDGELDVGEGGLSGWEFTLYKADGVTKVTTDAYGNSITNPKTTDANGDVVWEDLMPGDYVVKETPQDHWLSITGLSRAVSFASCTSETVVNFGNVHLGNIKVRKFYDSNRNGTRELWEDWLSGWQFTLYEADGVTMVTEDGYGNAITNPQTTGAGGYVVWEDLMPGTYVVKETLKSGWISTTGASQTVQFESCTPETSVKFGNFRAHGLTPGFWKNWRNHFSDSQFQALLSGTIAPTIVQADTIFEHWEASPDKELTILKAMLLANQLTLNLSASWPDNPYGWLAPYVSIEGMGTLQDAINQALAILADPGAYSRYEILAVKDKLDAFANLN